VIPSYLEGDKADPCKSRRPYLKTKLKAKALGHMVGLITQQAPGPEYWEKQNKTKKTSGSRSIIHLAITGHVAEILHSTLKLLCEYMHVYISSFNPYLRKLFFFFFLRQGLTM
jgi:hypothetical protein